MLEARAAGDAVPEPVALPPPSRKPRRKRERTPRLPPCFSTAGARERIARTDALSICIGHIGGSLRGGTETSCGFRRRRGATRSSPQARLHWPPCIRRDIRADLLRPIDYAPITARGQRPPYLSLGRLPSRTSRNSFGPFRSRRLRRCRSSSGADGSIKRSISWAAISDAFAAFLVRTPFREALGAWSVTRIDLHSSQTMPAVSWSFFSFAFITSRTIGRTFSHVSHHAREKRSSKSMI